MKNFLKVLGVLAAIVGIVAWARKALKKFRGEKFYCFDEDFCADTVEANDIDFQA